MSLLILFTNPPAAPLVSGAGSSRRQQLRSFPVVVSRHHAYFPMGLPAATTLPPVQFSRPALRLEPVMRVKPRLVRGVSDQPSLARTPSRLRRIPNVRIGKPSSITPQATIVVILVPPVPSKVRRVPFLRRSKTFSPVLPQVNPPLPIPFSRPVLRAKPQLRRVKEVRAIGQLVLHPELIMNRQRRVLPVTPRRPSRRVLGQPVAHSEVTFSKRRRLQLFRLGKPSSITSPSIIIAPTLPLSVPNKMRRVPFLRRGATGPVAAPQVVFGFVPLPTSDPNKTRRISLTRRTHLFTPVPSQVNPPLALQSKTLKRMALPARKRTVSVSISQVDVLAPRAIRRIVVSPLRRTRAIAHGQGFEHRLASARPKRVVVPVLRSRRTDPLPKDSELRLVFERARRVAATPLRARPASIVPAPTTTSVPLPTMFARPPRKTPFLRRTKIASPVLPQATPVLPTMFSRPSRKAPLLARKPPHAPVAVSTQAPSRTVLRRRAPGFLRRLIRRVLGPLPFVAPPAIVGGSVTIFDSLTQTVQAKNFRVTTVDIHDGLATATVVASDKLTQTARATDLSVGSVKATDRIL
jgi:hypothetical protein